jgi:hydroxyacyl-ACP dehydratase HTD2-like protein with hotdog domain
MTCQSDEPATDAWLAAVPRFVSRDFTPSEVDLFMFCASTWNTHRIHYDREYARSEGYDDLVVPGPLQAARVASMLHEFATRYGGGLVGLSVRHHQPVYCNRRLVLKGRLQAPLPDGAEVSIPVSVSVANADGHEVSTGSATLILTPPQGNAASRGTS